MAVVVDANVLVRGKNKPFESAITVQEVLDELKSQKARTSLTNYDVEVRQPSEDSIIRVTEFAESINSPTSKADELVVALALDTDSIVISDDLAVQNLARHLGVEYDSFLAERIEETRTWKLVCKNCGRTVGGDKCVCGSTRFQRKPS